LKGCTNAGIIECSWIKIVNEFNCISKEKADLCEYYINLNDCTRSGSGEECLWNSTIGKCTSNFKTCDKFTSNYTCNTINDRCFWNEKCIDLEKEYKCSNLTMVNCKNYINIEGLTIIDEPCFFNNYDDKNDDEKGYYCTSIDSVKNTICDNIKTNSQISDENSPKYCDNAQLIFKINGNKNLGCEWNDKTKNCIDISEETENPLPENCSEYTVESCNYNFSRDGKECFWNYGDSKGACIAMNDIDKCNKICSNDISGINTHFCDGNNIKLEICKWGEEKEGNPRDCNCEGISIPENCTSFKVTSPSDCKKLDSCFFNRKNEDNIGNITCTDIDDISECKDILNDSLCKYAKKYTFHNLESFSSTSEFTFLCIWDIEHDQCISKKLNKINIVKSGKTSYLILIIIIIIGIVIIIIIIIIFILIIKKIRNHKNGKENKELEMNNPSFFFFFFFFFFFWGGGGVVGFFFFFFFFFFFCFFF
jgi:hypothetical protein